MPRQEEGSVTDNLMPDVGPDIPHGARIWNYWLGGKDNYAADRELVEPGIVPVTQWRPDGVEVGRLEPIDASGGVARKP
jgi:S-adenosyl methyltransferase